MNQFQPISADAIPVYCFIYTMHKATFYREKIIAGKLKYNLLFKKKCFKVIRVSD